MQIFNLVYKVKKAKTEKSGVVDRLLYLNNKRFLKPLLGFKYVNPLHFNNLKYKEPVTTSRAVLKSVACLTSKLFQQSSHATDSKSALGLFFIFVFFF